ncbi:MAG: hypothetical protein WC107_01175 [Patescibacteria group bacterium]
MEKFHQPEFETQPKQRTHDLLNLSSGEEIEFNERVAMFNGQVRVFVHPFYWLSREPVDEDTKNSEIEALEVIKFLFKLFETDKDKFPPTIVMDEYAAADEVKDIYDRKVPDDRSIYTVETLVNESMPAVTRPEGFDEDEIEAFIQKHFHEYWQKMIDVLKKAGVKKIIISGMDLELTKIGEETPEYVIETMLPYLRQRYQKGVKNFDYYAKYCVGTAVWKLASDFEIEISRFAVPHGRKELLDYEKGRSDLPEETEEIKPIENSIDRNPE